MKFQFEFRSSFGKKYFYPIDSNAHTLCKCFSKETLMGWQMDILFENKWDIEIYTKGPKDEMNLLNRLK